MDKYIDKLNELLEKELDAEKSGCLKWALTTLENSQGSVADKAKIDVLYSIAQDEKYAAYAQAVNWLIYSLEYFFI